MAKITETKNIICGDCGQMVFICPVCGDLFQIDDEIICYEIDHHHKKCEL